MCVCVLEITEAIFNYNLSIFLLHCIYICSTVENPKMFCIDFEDDDLVSDTWGEYRPWVLNDGVTVVEDEQCPQGKKCGFFNGSGVLEVPFFSNNYGHWPNLRIELQYKMISFEAPIDQGIVSNDCFPDGDGLYADGNSLFISANDETFNAGLKDVTKTGPTVTAVSNIESSHSTYPRVATQCIIPACDCTIIYKQSSVSRIMSVCGKLPATE